MVYGALRTCQTRRGPSLLKPGALRTCQTRRGPSLLKPDTCLDSDPDASALNRMFPLFRRRLSCSMQQTKLQKDSKLKSQPAAKPNHIPDKMFAASDKNGPLPYLVNHRHVNFIETYLKQDNCHKHAIRWVSLQHTQKKQRVPFKRNNLFCYLLHTMSPV